MVLGSVSTVIADVFIKKATVSWNLRAYVLGCLFYIATIPGWYFYMKGTKFATCGMLYSTLTNTLLFLLGISYFNESVSFRQWLGLGFGAASVILLSVET